MIKLLAHRWRISEPTSLAKLYDAGCHAVRGLYR